MVLYHGTTGKRAQQILESRAIKKDCRRFFTEAENGNGFSTNGYVYLTNEVIFALNFAYCHHLVDKSDSLFIFRVDIPDELLLPDYDEIRHQSQTDVDPTHYSNALRYGLLEYKTCRINWDLSLDEYYVEYCCQLVSAVDNIQDLFDNAGYNYEYVIQHYTARQKAFIQSIQWTHA